MRDYTVLVSIRLLIEVFSAPYYTQKAIEYSTYHLGGFLHALNKSMLDYDMKISRNYRAFFSVLSELLIVTEEK